ncbi:MAG: peptidase C45, partial [Bacteroidetes bacterium]|nr:peptidase C45 [Bacteroidota bacterium]
MEGIVLVIAGVFVLLLLLFAYLSLVSRTRPPEVENKDSLQWRRTEHGNGFYSLNNNWFRKSKSGLYELYVEGEPFERGVVNGKLSGELVQKQEDHFNEQINKLVPSKFYLHFLKYFVGWFNRHLPENIAEEYKQEIYGISQSASGKYHGIGSNYQRILNYHAAHDIGHALQNMALVGCTSFATWAQKSENGEMIIGRNFDFYAGDKFAEEKIVAFFNPAQGFKFMTITWGGFIGAVSGMNDKGLTVTINAAKSKTPTGSATPVSLVAREILQYAQNIEQALTIAKKRKMFVSESFLIGSASDNKAVLIEKTPDALDVYDPGNDWIACANHFQGNRLSHTKSNTAQMEESASLYRQKRLTELLNESGKNTVLKTIAILRDQKGMNGKNIGMGNEKVINQLIAHHSIVFEPKKLLAWVSTAPWQLGEYVAYDLEKVFEWQGMKEDREICETAIS